MSKVNICDITGDIVSADDIGEHILEQKQVDFNGKLFDIKLIVQIDAWNGSQQTNIKSSLWDNNILPKIRDWLVNQYGS